ncbi:hypothetical protein [Oscillibacter sp.]|uniref:hypothetical protein n=1 Tax=Oscillibacter sp. TaxID=1945593 RepID=UPI002608E633|nr:hypothetical protein [Oscillibacter sp.]MDD3346601.1 hypothetical protein [Oscillibacter sp.]
MNKVMNGFIVLGSIFILGSFIKVFSQKELFLQMGFFFFAVAYTINAKTYAVKGEKKKARLITACALVLYGCSVCTIGSYLWKLWG